ncbi:PAS domain S-box-containing protein [Bradyrhizobium sp. S3.9.1]
MENSDRFDAAQSSEGRYRLLVEAITDYAIYMLDRDGHVTSWNPGAKRFKGYEAEEIIGHHFSTFYTEAEREQKVPALALEEAERTGRFEREGWRVRKDGTQFWAHVIIDAIRSPKGELVGFAKITRDLTERRAAEAKLRESEQQFRLMVQSVTDYAIYMLDVEGNVASWNAGAQRIKGTGPKRSSVATFPISIRKRIAPRASREQACRPQPAKDAGSTKVKGSERTALAFGRMS